MPLKVSKREGSPFWQITGSLAGQRVRESSGTADRQQAELKRIEIEQALLSRRKRREDLGWIPYVRVKKPKAVRPPPKWANEKWFATFFKHASPELIAIVKFLAGTGCRISEVLLADWKDTNLDEGWTYVRMTKNGEPRLVYLPPFIVEVLRPYEKDKGRLFTAYASRFSVNKAIRSVCKKGRIEYLSTHKVGSHTYATNLSIYAGMDARALTETGRWKDPKSTHFYTHFATREMAKKADTLAHILTQTPAN